MENLTKPNETAKELERLRKESIKKAYDNTKNRNKKDESEDEIPPESKSQEKKLDNDEKNDYIEENESSSETSDGDEVEDKDKELFEKQFKGDPVKAVKSWRETQRAYMKLQNSTKEKDEYFNKLSKMLEDNPLLEEVIEKAENNEDIESFLASKFKESEQDKPKEQSKSKPNITENIDGVDEKTLFESGYLDPAEREHITADQWDEKRRQASIRYMYNELPNRMAEQAATKYQEQIEEANRQRELRKAEDRNKQLIEDRWLDGIEKISTEYGFDFVNNEEHQELLKDIQKRTSAYRDPDNMSVIGEDAVEIAAERVLRERNLINQFKTDEPSAPSKDKNLYDKNQLDVNVRNKATSEPKTVADKLSKRHLESYQRQMAKRQNVKSNK